MPSKSILYDINSESVDVTEHSDSKTVKLLRLPQESWIVRRQLVFSSKIGSLKVQTQVPW